MSSMRELQEDTLVRHWKRPAGWCARCAWPWPCEDYKGAVEAIRILDESHLDILASTDAHGTPSLANAYVSVPDPNRKPR